LSSNGGFVANKNTVRRFLLLEDFLKSFPPLDLTYFRLMKALYFFLFLALISCKPDYKWTSIGDSITRQNGRDYKDGNEAIGYQDLFIKAQKTPIYLDNQGYNGLPLSGSDKSVYSKMKDYDFKESNLITIFVGTNDFKLNKPIIDRDTLNSFSYCLNKLVSNIKKQNPQSKIYLLTPLQRNNDNYSIYSTNKVGLKLSDYSHEIKSVGLKYNISVIDLYNESGITINNLTDYTYDGLHPNNYGYKRIFELLNKKIKL
jgi:lysophospholipase L1-like esterase